MNEALIKVAKELDELKEECVEYTVSNVAYKYEIECLKKENKHYKETIDEVREYINFLHNNCKYRLNDGHLKKLKKILDKVGDISE